MNEANFTTSRTDYNATTDEVVNNEELAKQLTDEFRNAVLPVTTFVGIEVFLGFVGNLLVLYVFYFRYHVCNFRYFVLCLAMTDITSSLTTMPGEMITQLNWYTYRFKMICKVKSFFNVFTVSSEALCLLTIALDRYRKVCQPFGWQIKPHIAKYLCLIIYAVSFFIALPVAFFWGLRNQAKVYKETNITVTVSLCEKDGKYEMTKQPLTYSLTVEGLIGAWLTLMFGMYMFVARKLLQEKRAGFTGGHSTAVASSSQTGASSDFCNQEISDTGYSSGIENKSKNKSVDFDDIALSDDKPKEKKANLGNTLQVPDVSFGNKRSDNNSNSYSTRRPRDKSVDVEDTFTSDDDPEDSRAPASEIQHAQSNGQTLNRTTLQRRHRDRPEVGKRVRRKTLIMLILTVLFIITTILYLTLLSFIARSDDILSKMSDGGKAVYFFFFRLYFINHVINPVVYGALDPKFRRVMRKLIRRRP